MLIFVIFTTDSALEEFLGKTNKWKAKQQRWSTIAVVVFYQIKRAHSVMRMAGISQTS